MIQVSVQEAVLPDIYDKLTTNDFIVGMSNSTATVGSPNTGTYTAYSYTVNCGKTLSYNAKEGKLTFGYTRGHYAPNPWSSTFLDANGVFAVWRGTINGVVPS